MGLTEKLSIHYSFHPAFGILEYQVALFHGYHARDRPSKKAKNLPGSDVTYRINSASIVINTHIFSGDIGTWALVGYMVIAVLINFLRRGLSCKVCKAFENELNLPMTKSWFERIYNPCISFYTWFMWFYNSSCTVHVVYLLNPRLEHSVFRILSWIYFISQVLQCTLCIGW